jgi:mitogen-activated protein kinase kinase
MGQLDLSKSASPLSNLRSPTSPASVGRRRGPKLQLKDIIGPEDGSGDAAAAGLGAGIPNRSSSPVRRGPSITGTPFSSFKKIVLVSISTVFYPRLGSQLIKVLPLFGIIILSDPSGALNFGGKAVLHAAGVDFSNGSSFAINMNQLQLAEELGRGNYGTVKKVLHRPTNVAMAMKVC